MPTATSYGTAQNKTAASTVAFTTTALIPANTLLVIGVCADNVAAATPTISSITAVGGGTWSDRAGSVTQSGATATAGAGVFVYCQTLYTASSVASGTSITVTFNASPVAKAVALWGFDNMGQHVLRGTVVSAVSTVGTPSAATAGTLVAGDLVIGVVGTENSAIATGDADTLNGSWSTINGIASTVSTAATNTSIAMQYKVITAAGVQTFNPTGGVADTVAIVFAMAPLPAAITQASYRFYGDGTESASTALAAQDTSYSADLTAGDVNLLLRTRLQSTNVIDLPATDDFQLQWEKNANGVWSPVSTSNEALADGYDETNLNGSISVFTGNDRQGQSFLGNGGSLLRAGFFMSKTGTPTFNLVAYLYAHTGTYGAGGLGTGSVLATSTARAATSLLPTVTPQWEEFVFDGTFTLVAGTPYVILVGPDTTGDVSNAAALRVRNSTGTHPGAKMAFSPSNTWGTTTTADIIFRVVATASAVIAFNSANLTDGAATTNRLGAGTGSFTAGKVSEDGLVDNLGWPGNNYTELLYALTLAKAGLADGDTMRFRVVRNLTYTEMTYTQTPTIPVSIPPPTTTTPRNIHLSNAALQPAFNR